MKRLTIAFVAVVALFAGTAAAQTKYVAVVETEVDEQSGVAAKLNKAEVREITTVLRNEARNILPPGKYKIMTAETIIAQGSAKLEECAEENCVIALGAKIGADYIVRGTVSKFGTKLTLSVLMYETEDGTLVGSARVSSDKAEELLDRAVAACGEMYRKFESEQAGGQKAAMPPTQQSAAVVAPQPTYQTPVPTTTPTPTSTPTSTPTPIYQPLKIDGPILTDSRDGKAYKTVVIGGKRWMAENLNHQPLQWGRSWCYNNDNSYCNRYGRLYDWKTAKTVCPSRFHLPSRQEWDNLVATVGGSSVAGKKLKSTNGWKNNGNGSDDFGFLALPGGYRRYSGGLFYSAGYNGYWWTVSETGAGNAYRRYMGYGNDDVGNSGYGKENGLAVRCVED